MIPVGAAQCRARLKRECGRGVPAVLNGRQEVRRLTLVKWNPHLLCQPWVIEVLPRSPNQGGVPILIIHAPSRVRTFRQIDKALPLPLEISVMVDGKDIAMVIKIEVLAVAQTTGKNLEPASVRVAAQDAARMRVTDTRPLFCQDIHTTIAHAPIELAVIALDNAVEVMIAVADVGGEAMGNALPAVRHPVAICIGQLPEIGNNRGVDVPVDRRDAVGYSSQNFVEAVGKKCRLVKHPIGVLVLQCVDLLAAHRQVLDVHLAVTVVVAHSLARGNLS